MSTAYLVDVLNGGADGADGRTAHAGVRVLLDAKLLLDLAAEAIDVQVRAEARGQAEAPAVDLAGDVAKGAGHAAPDGKARGKVLPALAHADVVACVVCFFLSKPAQLEKEARTLGLPEEGRGEVSVDLSVDLRRHL